MTKLEILFDAIDFWPILEYNGIEPESITEYEWSKFTDSFLDGTGWYEVADLACDRILEIRRDAVEALARKVN